MLALGLPPATLAGDATFRLDVLAASALALAQGRDEAFHLDPGGHSASNAIADLLTAATVSLDEKGIISLGAPPGINVTLMGGIGTREGWRAIDFEQAPRIFDRYLAHACLESLLSQPAVHPYLMRKYGDGSEVWQRLMREGYGSGPGP